MMQQSIDADETGMSRIKAVTLIRKELLKVNCSFNGTFKDGCQSNVAPDSLIALLSMIMFGPNDVLTMSCFCLQSHID